MNTEKQSLFLNYHRKKIFSLYPPMTKIYAKQGNKMEMAFCVSVFVFYLLCLLSISSGLVVTSQGKVLCPGLTLPLMTAYKTESFPSQMKCFSRCLKYDSCLAVSYRKSDRFCYLFNYLADDDCYGLVPDLSVKFLTKIYPYACLNGGIKEDNTTRPCRCVNDYVDTWCQRLMRDCRDEGNYGYYKTARYYKLKPKTSTTTFSVLCYLGNNKQLTLVAYIGRSTPDGYFNKNWEEMKTNFNIQYHSIWGGLELLHHLTLHRKYRMQIFVKCYKDMWGNENLNNFMNYLTNVKVANESENYRISFSSIEFDRRFASLNGSVTFMNNSEFSTYDRDNDQHPDLNCAVLHESPFWFKACGESNPLGTVRRPANSLERPKRMYFDGIEGKDILTSDVQIYLWP